MLYDWTTAPFLPRRGCRTPRRGPATRLVATIFTVTALYSLTALVRAAVASGPPATLAPPTAGVAGWSTWTPVAGGSFLSPCVALNPATGTLEVAAVGLDLNITHYQVSGSGVSSLTTGRPTFLPPVLLSDAAGTAQLLVTGLNAAVTLSRFQNNAWSAPIPSGMQSFLPPAAVIESDGATLDLVVVGPDGGLRHARFAGGVWSSPVLLNAITLLPPALTANPGGGVELAIVGLDRQIYHARFAAGQWGAFEPTGVLTDAVPALAVSADGVIHLAATGVDRGIVHSRFLNSAWTAPVPTGAQSDLAPAMVYNSGTNSVELLARGIDRTVQHARFLDSAWKAPVSLEITTDVRPALIVDGKGGLDAAVTATDGKVYVSHHTGAAPPPPPASPPPPSFARDILRIFTNNGAKTCAQSGCHSGSHPTGNQNLEKDKAYANIVNVASSEQPKLKRVLPGDAADSYLFQKVAAGLMPRTGGTLTAGDIDLIRQWITAGAPNN